MAGSICSVVMCFFSSLVRTVPVCSLIVCVWLCWVRGLWSARSDVIGADLHPNAPSPISTAHVNQINTGRPGGARLDDSENDPHHVSECHILISNKWKCYKDTLRVQWLAANSCNFRILLGKSDPIHSPALGVEWRQRPQKRAGCNTKRNQG